jgi:hypothetical protein
LNLHLQQAPPAGSLEAVIVRRIGERPFRPDATTGQERFAFRATATGVGPFDIVRLDRSAKPARIGAIL